MRGRIRRGQASQIEGRSWKRFQDGQAPTRASISGNVWSNFTDGDGLTNFRWRHAGDVISLFVPVQVDGDQSKVTAFLHTNANNNANPDDWYDVGEQNDRGIEVVRHPQGNQVIFEFKVPIQNIGNYKATAFVSTDGGQTKSWGGGDFRFRSRWVGWERVNEDIVGVRNANSAPGAHVFSKFEDLIRDEFGNYNLQAIIDGGYNAVRIQDLLETRGAPSPYAAADFYAGNAWASGRVARAGVQDWDWDQKMALANDEIRDVVDAGHGKGLLMGIDIALNHVNSGHFTFRDFFRDRAVGDQVMSDNFSQIMVNEGQAQYVQDAIARLGREGSAQEKFPWFFADKNEDRTGASMIYNMMPGGNGEWPDVLQLNHGSFNWGCRDEQSDQTKKVCDYLGRVVEFWTLPRDRGGMGFDFVRFDHASNLPNYFWEHTMNQVQARVGKPVGVLHEDFNQFPKLNPWADSREDWHYRPLMDRVKAFDAGGIKQNLFQGASRLETRRTGNHDEPRASNNFESVGMKTFYQCLITLVGGWTTKLMADEFLEGNQYNFKEPGNVPPTMWMARQGTLPDANKEAKFWNGKAGWAKNTFPALQTTLQRDLYSQWGDQPDVLAIARHADDRNQDTVLLFANLSQTLWREQKYWLDDETKSRIDPNAYYQAKDVMSWNPGRGLWDNPIRGQDLINDGVWVNLSPIQIQALKLERV
jgi:hypothetical protein